MDYIFGVSNRSLISRHIVRKLVQYSKITRYMVPVLLETGLTKEFTELGNILSGGESQK